MRLTVPMGLNMCPPFHSISKTEKPPSILLPAKSVVEDEMRRNAFWLAFATERLHGLGNGWALSLDDQDVSQLLPVRGDQFILGVRLPFSPIAAKMIIHTFIVACTSCGKAMVTSSGPASPTPR
jgi:hypothetical protein